MSLVQSEDSAAVPPTRAETDESHAPNPTPATVRLVLPRGEMFGGEVLVTCSRGGGGGSSLVRQGGATLRFRVWGLGFGVRVVVRGAPAFWSGWLRSEIHVRDRVCVGEILR